MQRHPKWKTLTGLAAAAAVSLTACNSNAPAEDSGPWEPTQDVTITVAFPAGGGTDAAARALAAGLEEERGINVVVVNRDGGSGTVGYTYAAQQSKNPHELAFVEPGFVTVPETTEVSFAVDDFTPIGGVSLYTSTIVTAPGAFDDLQALLDAASGGETLTVGFPNATGPQAMTVELIEDAIGAEFEHIVYQNGGEIAAGVAAGDLDFGLTALEHAQGFIDDDRLEALAVFSDERIENESFAEVPTAVESGLDVSFSGFRGLVAGGELTEEQVEYWVSALEDYRDSEAFEESLSMTMTQELDESGEDFATFMDDFRGLVSPILPNLGA